MRWAILAIGILVAGLLGLGQPVSENATSNDGGVPWPIDVLQDGSVPYPVNEEAISFLCPIPAVALCCLLRGCIFYPGQLLYCSCTADGWVVCLYYRCFDLPFPPCCFCGHEFDYPGIRCEPGAPVPQQHLEAEKD